MVRDIRYTILASIPLLCGILLLAAFAFETRLKGDIPVFFRDPIVLIEKRSILSGVFSQLGAVLWLSSATITATSALLGWQTQQLRPISVAMLSTLENVG